MATSIPTRPKIDTLTITERAAFRGGIVHAEVNEIVDRLPLVDVPGAPGRCRCAEPAALSNRSAVHARIRDKIRNEYVSTAMMGIAAGLRT